MSDSQSLSVFQDQALSEPQRTFCDLIADCMGIAKATERMGWTRSLYRKMREDLPAFDAAVTRAREMAQDLMVDKMHDIAAEEADVNRARLKIDTIRWAASKIKPRMYGDKLDVVIDHRIDISDALAAARARATLRPMCDPADTIDAEFEALSSVEPVGSIDKQSLPQLPDIFD
jgi:hypothetical protein